MEKITLFQKGFTNENNVQYQLLYSLLIRSSEWEECYGIAVEKADLNGNAETEQVEGLCENRKEAEAFLFRLAEGQALPVELVALCDDYISEKEQMLYEDRAVS